MSLINRRMKAVKSGQYEATPQKHFFNSSKSKQKVESSASDQQQSQFSSQIYFFLL